MKIGAVWGLVLLLVGCGAAREEAPETKFQPQPFNLLSSCRTKSLNRFARGAECPGVRLLFVSREGPAEEVLRGMQAALVAYKYTAVERVLSVNGRDQPALEYQMGAGDTPALHVFFTAFQLAGSSESIEAQCFAEHGLVEPKRCAGLLDAFIAQGLLRGEWPRVLSDTAPHDAFILHVAKRDVRLPSSCDQLSPLDFDCRDGHVRLFVSDTADKLSRMENADLEASKDESMIRERAVPCTLENVPTTCTMRRFRLPYSDEMLSFRGSAVVNGVPLLLSCDVKKSHAPTVPGPICTQFFTFEADVLEDPQTLIKEE